MKSLSVTSKHWRVLCPSIAALALAACGNESENRFVQPPAIWAWTDLGGPPAAISEFAGNHKPLLVLDGELLLGTGDGVWRRRLSGTPEWARAGLDGLTVHAMALNADGSRVIAAGFDPGDQTAPTAWYSTDSGASWIAAADWPRGQPGGTDAGVSFWFYALESDPIDADVVYGGLDGDTVAVTVDGGASWFMADGVTSPTFGYPCVLHRPAAVSVLMQGCELPLDDAWIGARNVVETDRFQLPDFRYLFGGYVSHEDLGNRRINAIAAPSGRTDRVLAGVEGGLVALTTASGQWADRSDVSAQWLFRSDEDTSSPYSYIRAIVPLDEEGRHVLFGGPLNGDNAELPLFETTNNGRTVWIHDAPIELHDPRLEQAWRLSSTDVLLVIGHVDPTDPLGSLAPHWPRVYRLQRP